MGRTDVIRMFGVIGLMIFLASTLFIVYNAAYSSSCDETVFPVLVLSGALSFQLWNHHG